MDDPNAESIPPVDWSVREASKADALVLLLGESHGGLAEEPNGANTGVNPDRLREQILGDEGWSSVDQPEKLSYTQWEVLAALEADVPIYVFCPDRHSDDPDLRVICADAKEPESLRLRQQQFRKWLSRKLTADQFKSRIDLINQVRAALQRRQRALASEERQEIRRRGFLVAGSVVCFIALLLFFLPRAFTRGGGHDRPELKWAFALGTSVAMIGQSSTSAGALPFERSLRELDIPSARSASLCERYATLGQAVLDRKMPYAEASDEIRRSTWSDLEIEYGELVVVRADLGFGIAYLSILIDHWDSWNDQQRTPEARRALDQLKTDAAKANLPAEQLRRIRALDAAQCQSRDGRDAMVGELNYLLGEHDPLGNSFAR